MEEGMAASGSSVINENDVQSSNDVMEQAMGALSKELQFESLSEKEERKREQKAQETGDVAAEKIDEELDCLDRKERDI